MKKLLLKFIILLIILVTGCSADLTTKAIVKSEFKEQSLIVINNYFNITYVENHAVAFGFLGRMDKNIRLPLIFILVTIEVLFLIYMIWRYRDKKVMYLLPFAFILAGAFGNNIDRALNGFVTDYFYFHYKDLYSFYVFNIADILINIGIVLLIIQYKSSNINLTKN